MLIELEMGGREVGQTWAFCLKGHHLSLGSVDRDRLEPVQLLNQRMLQPRSGGAIPAVTAKPAVRLYFEVIRKNHSSLSDNSKPPVQGLLNEGSHSASTNSTSSNAI